MTARHRGGSRPCGDGRYFTPDALAEAHVALLPPIPAGAFVLEAHAGGGAYVRALIGRRHRTGERFSILVMDRDPRVAGLASIEPEHGDRAAVGDFLQLADWPADWPDRVWAVVGNPPYSVRLPVLGKDGQPLVYPPSHKRRGQLRERVIEVGTDHTLRALELATHVVSFLLRAGFAGGIERYGRLFAGGRLASRLTVVPRPSFTGGGSDATEFETFTFRPLGEAGEVAGGWLVWNPDRRQHGTRSARAARGGTRPAKVRRAGGSDPA